ncbi:oligosaccharide flippase family protein [bacterium]|nr:oligosaccharide flippase family protein [bacterium]MBU1433416.1 oligosaccharide flippase family protein [bacterium]
MSNTSLHKNAIANYVGQFYSILIGVVMLPFYITYLGSEAYGLVGFFTMLNSWMMLLDMGLSSTLIREVAKLKDKFNGLYELKVLLRSIEAVFLLIAIVVFFTIYFNAPWIVQEWLDIQELLYEDVLYCIQLMAIMLCFRWFIGLYQGAVIGFENQVWLNVYKVGINTLKFVGAFLLIKYITNEIYYFFIYQAIVTLLEYVIIRNKVYSLLIKTIFIWPSFEYLKRIAPFALSIAYISAVWIMFSQMDKLLLSHYIPLSEYGYFTLVVIVSGAVTQLAAPISQAFLPHMTSLISNKKDGEMIIIYHKGTQLLSIIIISVVAIISFFSFELIYAWTGDKEASTWVSQILIWYVIGNGILAIVAFQYYLQYAYGNLKYHLKFNTVFPFITLPIMYYAIANYGAIGSALSWFAIQLVTFMVWPPFIHKKFAPGIHKDWIIKDIMPALSVTSIYIVLLKLIDIDFKGLDRIEIILTLILLGIFLLILNWIAYPFGRKYILKIWRNYAK